MVKAKGARRKKGAPVAPVYDSDDERAYEGEPVPDKAAADYFNDEIDTFHANKEKLLLEKGAQYGPEESNESDEEVMALSDSDDEAKYEAQLRRLRASRTAEEFASDVEEEQTDQDLSEDKAWGKLRSRFYGADVEDEEDIDLSGGEEDGVAVLEEQEALALQRKIAERLDDDDFGLAAFQAPPKDAEHVDEAEATDRVVKDVSKLSKREKLELLKKECPELVGILKDYKAKLEEYLYRLVPLLELIEKGSIPATSGGAGYVRTKAVILSNYFVNVQFYLMLRAKQTPGVRHHPVMKRLVQYRNLAKSLEPAEANLKEEMDAILKKVAAGEEVKPRASAPHEMMRPTKDGIMKKLTNVAGKAATADAETRLAAARTQRQGDRYETQAEKEALEFYKMMKHDDANDASDAGSDATDDERRDTSSKGEEKAVDGDQEDVEGDQEDVEGDLSGKRAATYQIVKNRGLTPRRKKEYKNPRVKHRIKYQKAKVRRKGQVREVRKELTPYAGEISGIRAGIKKGIKIRS